MAQIADAFPKASFGGIEFPYTGIEIVGSLDHHVHKYIHRPGGEVEELGRHLYEVNFTCVFDTGSKKWQGLYPTILSRLIALCEIGKTQNLVIPNRGVKAMRAKATKWATNFTAKIRSGEAVKFSFIEDTSDQFSPYQLLTAASSDLSSLIIVCQNMAVTLALNPNIFAALVNAINAFQFALDQDEMAAFQVISAINAVISICFELDSLAVLTDPVNWALYDAFTDVYSSAIVISLDVTGAGRAVDTTIVPSLMTVTDLSMFLYQGDPSRVTDLLSVNSFSNAFAIPGGFLVNYFVP